MMRWSNGRIWLHRAWPVLAEVARVCEVTDLSDVRHDWSLRYREQLQQRFRSPLGVELRVLIGEKAATLRDLSPRLGFNYSVLIREFQRLDRDEPLKWFHVERILRAAGVQTHDSRWEQIHAWWYSTRADI